MLEVFRQDYKKATTGRRSGWKINQQEIKVLEQEAHKQKETDSKIKGDLVEQGIVWLGHFKEKRN